MSQPDRHNRQDGQIQNLRTAQVYLRVVTYIALAVALVAIAIYVYRHGFAALWQKVRPFFWPCCALPVAVGVIFWLLVMFVSWKERSRTKKGPDA
jgi:peptidoglycan biosynthesis protein MviN/MurJ (putative lipid II flippase)